MNWKAIPFVRLLLPFAGGIAAAIVYQPFITLSTGLFACLMILWLLNFFSAHARSWRRRHWFGAGVFLWMFMAGATFVAAHHQWRHPAHIVNTRDKGQWLLAIARQTHDRGDYLKVGAHTIALIDTHTMMLSPAKGRLILYLAGRDKQPMPGDTILYKGIPDTIETPKNPQAFNYQQYLHRKQIYFSAYAKPEEWRVWGADEHPNLMAVAERLRMYCVQILQCHLPGLRERTVAPALVLGYQDAIPDEVNQAYSYTGAMHVLSVSGLHVGLVYGALDMLLKKLRRRRRWRIIRLVLLLSGIWAFALITGAGAAVLRSAAMFSMMLAGQSLQRNANIYNTLAASAFLLLCVNPFFLFDMGFQLSYLALLGIVYFSPILYKCWYIPWKPIDYLWQLTCVGIAAQLATMPLSIYYFHQFPLYFWLSGWLVVPLGAMILYIGCLLLALNSIPVLGMLTGKLLNSLVWILNESIFWIRDLPGGQTRYLPLSIYGATLLYICIFGLAMLWHTRKGRWALWCMGGLAAAALIHNIMAWQAQQTRELVIYHIKGHTAIDLFEGRRLLVWSDLPAGDTRQEWACAAYRSSRYLTHIEYLTDVGSTFSGASLWMKNGLLQFGNTRLAIIDNKLPDNTPQQKLAVDYVLLRANAPVSLDNLSRYFNIKKAVIADASNKAWWIGQWQVQCKTAGIHFFEIGAQGAFHLFQP